MRGFFILFLLIISTSLSLNAQAFKELENSTPEKRASLFSAQLEKALDLNEEQMQLVSGINLAHAQKADEIVRAEGNKLSKLKKIKKLDKERDKQLGEVLDAAQFDIYSKRKREFVKNVRAELKALQEQ
ncbi:hypothetical protein GWK08_15950 [Leptobacterium flavescens]|uniref:DUF4168 domain-containing protein n=1 Tax=Leptobacterium flavescens TaxID=472055 RepID=A0A6P0UR17_9FLAO|nr:hypothetical protein [Leptobacterium flavescens]NER14950.1 hypothetical protein [Leptobacterium flavescens]